MTEPTRPDPATSRTDVVIGAASGMGAAVAESLAARGNCLLLADRDVDALARVAERCAAATGSAGEIVTVRCDITDPAQVAATAEQVPALGALVLTAGVSPNMDDGRQIYRINLIAADAVLDAFTATVTDGSVGVAFASSAGHLVPGDDRVDAILDDPAAPSFFEQLEELGIADNSDIAYAVSKRGVLRLVQRRAASWGRSGGRLLSLSPGIIDTPMGALEAANQPAMADMVATSAIPRSGRPDEIAAVVSFLVSDAASFMTGSDVLVDGGSVATMRFG